MEKKTINIKHPEIYIIAFFITIIIATVAFAYGCSNIDKKEPGYYVINPKNDPDIKNYATDFTFYAYLDGSSDEIVAKYNNIVNLYSERLARYYANVDEETIFTTYPSIAMINDKPNEEVLVGSDVVNFLKEALEHQTSYENYSIYASPLYSFWYTQFALNINDREARDPLNNNESITYLSTLANYINDPNHVNIEIIGEDKAKLVVSEEYQNFRELNDIDAPYVSLNIIKEEILLEAITNYLEENGVNNGFIVSEDGSVIQLSSTTPQIYRLYTLDENEEIIFYGYMSNNSTPSSMTYFRRFDLNIGENITNSYRIKKDNVTYYRSIYINIKNGNCENILKSSVITSADKDIVKNALINNELAGKTSFDDIENYLSNEELNTKSFVLNLINEPKNIYVNNSIKDNIKLNEELDYNLINI